MSVKVHEAFSLDSFMDRLLWFDHFLGAQVKDEWAVVGGPGTTTVIDAQTGGIVRFAPANGDTNQRRMHWNDIRSLHVDKKATMEFRLKMSHTSEITIEVGLYFDGNNLIEFRFDSRFAPATTWEIRTINGGAITSQDSGETTDTDYHIFRIEAFPTGQVHFYIDGVETTNSPITTNIPSDAADFLQPRFVITDRDDVTSKLVDVDYCVVRQEI